MRRSLFYSHLFDSQLIVNYLEKLLLLLLFSLTLTLTAQQTAEVKPYLGKPTLFENDLERVIHRLFFSGFPLRLCLVDWLPLRCVNFVTS